jgi:hypothetical protein
MGVTGWLIDTSALVRLAASPDAEEWATRIERGLVRITSITRLEIGYSARTATDLREAGSRAPLASIPVEYLTPAMEDRAMAVQASLAERGLHRAASIPDLPVAAAAEVAHLTVLHVDRDFDLIADVTGQAVERLVTA